MQKYFKRFDNIVLIYIYYVLKYESFTINNKSNPLPDPCGYCGGTAYITKNMWPEAVCPLCYSIIGLLSNKDYWLLKKHLKLIKNHAQPLNPQHLRSLSLITGIKQTKLLTLLYPLKK